RAARNTRPAANPRNTRAVDSALNILSVCPLNAETASGDATASRLGVAPPSPLRATISADLEDELAPEMARLAQPMGVGGFGQPIELDLGRADGAGLKQLGDALDMAAGASDRGPQRRDVVAVRLGRLRARRDEGRAAARLQHRERFLSHIPADGVEHGVAIFRNFREILRVVVDDFV